MPLLRPLLVALLLAQTGAVAFAADWQLVLSDRNRRVEIDRSSILSSDAGTKISWGRVVLTSDEAKASGYAMIKALNRYDCRNRSFVTIKRVYVDAEDNIVREEPVPDQSPLTVARNSVDERMWREVCDPPSAADLQKLASEAARLASAPAGAAGAPAQPPAPASPSAIAAPTPAATPMPPAKVARAEPPASPRAQAGTVSAAPPLAAARPDPATPPALVRAGETSAAAPSTAPPFETHVEIPAKFLPGGAPAGEPTPPRKSILPPLPGLAAKADAPPSPPPPAPAAEAPKPVPAAAPAGKPAAPVRTPPRAAERPAPAPSAAPKPAQRLAQAAPAEEPRPRTTPVRRAPDAERKPPRPTPTPAPTPAPTPSSTPRPAPAPAAAPVAAQMPAATMPPSAAGWSYDGETGPQNWGRLRPEWRLCGEGTRQSPIDLRDGIAVDLEPVRFHYGRSGFRIRDTGNTLQVDVGESMGIVVRGERYALERFTLHRPSQDRVGGMAHDMALYLEHSNAEGKRVILSVLLAAGGEAHPVLQTLWNNLPLDRGRAYTPDAVIDLARLVPADPGHFLYTGSLPTPPCTEDVLWVVMKQPLPIADDQLAVFARLYPRNGRPIQPSNGRLLLESR
ncbi:surface-adhesin E family protein [Thauera sp. JM12B12]|uniref:carbonic anhydrase n=1 Tax=Thauera sp. JM12B12 TaxID=3142262 RepID=UPI0031F4549C